jgi:hypothetical protein
MLSRIFPNEQILNVEILAQNNGGKISVGSQPSEAHKKTPPPVCAHCAQPEAAFV